MTLRSPRFVLAILLPAAAVLAQEPRPLDELLRELAGRCDIHSLFRFAPPQEPQKEPIQNQPEALGFAIERRLDQLPRRGAAETPPWSGWWWPMQQDGIAAGGAESPLGRYARARDLGAAPVAWERRHHGTAGDRRPESWWGHCNGWAAAAILEPMPARAVRAGDVTLTPNDLAALLTSVYFGCRAVGLDERYAGSDQPAVDAYGRATDRAFRDINPAVLHLMAANRIGVDRRAFVVDVSPGSQVWNHPLWAYEVLELAELPDGAAAVRAITGQPFTGAYPFAADVARFFAVRARFRVALALRAAGTPVRADAPERSAWLEYRYVLETDADGRVLGGEWIGASRLDHPDFCWVPLTPTSSYTLTPDGRYVVGTTGIGNPYVVYEDVVALLAGSADGAVAARPETGAGRWHRPVGASDVRWTRTFQLAQSQVQAADVQQAIATLTAPLDAAQAGQLVLPPAVAQELRAERGWLSFVASRTADALADYAELPDDGPLGPSVRARRALFLIARGDAVRALVEAAQAIAQNPDNPWGYCARAWVYLSRRAEHDQERAAVDLERAATLGVEPFVVCTAVQAGALGGRTQTVFQAQLQAIPARMAQVFVGDVRNPTVRQEQK